MWCRHEAVSAKSGSWRARILREGLGRGFGRLCWWFWFIGADFPPMFGLLPPLGRDEQPGLTATIHRRETFRAWDELH